MKKLYNRMISMVGDFHDILAMQRISPLLDQYQVWSASAMRPSAVAILLNDIIINNRNIVVECGAGVSTLLISKLLKNRGTGHLFSIEHDEDWANTVQDMLIQQGTETFVTVVHAPLNAWQESSGTHWYDNSSIKAEIEQNKIDLLIVDGPPAYTQDLRLARQPAVPFFTKYFNTDYAVILDDIGRPGEQEVLKSWETDLGIDAERLTIKYGNIGLLRTNKRYNLF